MKTSVKVGAYGAAVAILAAGAFGVGALTGSPIDMPVEHDGHNADSAMPAAGEISSTRGLQMAESGYLLTPISAPGSTGEHGTLSFTIHGPGGEPLTDFTENHEEDLHLILARSDTSGYRHVHPEMDEGGMWSIDWQWDAAGTYRVYADFVPADLNEGLTLSRTVDVAGDYAPEPVPEETVDEVGEYTVTLTGDVVAGETSPVTATIERDGRPVTDLDPYLGAYGHLVALRAGDLAYVHVHPDGEPGDGSTESGPEVTFSVEAPPGASTYRLYLDFRESGQMHTAEFAVAATESDGTDTDTADSDGGHGGH